ncbi:MAG: ComF family protein [Microbacterium sp.]|uniref:ComF family protein n=1 Tax=Microbacterium sp. TaxID=51671 RepID=UPI001AC0E883|nr:phosphoribosyltransferase family protein [Microbacterium sp.]MBN9212018.1 ComF family protein [Microbacterium sp.]
MASSSPTVWRRAIRGAVGDALAFWFPVACAGCGALDVDICEGCLAALVPRVVRRRLRADVEVFSALEFDGVAARVIRAMKSDGRTGLARALGPALAAALAAAPADATVTTVPASRAADRLRGYRPVDLLVRSAGARAVPLLRMRRRSADQRGLTRSARQANVAGLFVARTPPAGPVVVVDDVLTTGATLGDAVSALRAAGARDIVAVALAHTPRRSGSSRESEVIDT